MTRMRLIAGIAFATLATVATNAAAGARPSVSHIVYRCGPAFSNLCRVDPSSSVVTELTRDGKPGGPLYAAPSYSRDGKKLTFTFGNDLYVARGDATRRVLLEHHVVLDSLSPDGRWVTVLKILPDPIGAACPSYLCIGKSVPYLFIRPTGSGKLQTVARAIATTGWWQGRIIIGHRESLEQGQSICVLKTNVDFHCERNVAADPVRDLWGPAGSPDGRYIAAAAAPRPGPNEAPTKLDGPIALFSAATGKLVRDLTQGQHDSLPAWSPDGSLVAFNRGRSIYVIRADGSDTGHPRLLVRSGLQPTWGR